MLAEASPAAPSAFRAGVAYVKEIWDYRYFWGSLVTAELRRRYRRSVLGVGWSLMHPVAMTIVLSLVYSKLLGMSLREFGPLLLTGFAVWNFVHGAALQGCSSFISAEGYIRQQALPLAIYPLRTVLVLGFHFLISVAMALVFVWLALGFGNVTVLWALIPALALLFLFCWSVAILTSFAHSYFPDTQHFLEVGLQVVFFLTPIMYPPRILNENGLVQVVKYNPIGRLLNLIRMPLVEGQVPTLFQFSVAAALVAVTAALAVAVLYRYERKLVFAL